MTCRHTWRSGGINYKYCSCRASSEYISSSDVLRSFWRSCFFANRQLLSSSLVSIFSLMIMFNYSTFSAFLCIASSDRAFLSTKCTTLASKHSTLQVQFDVFMRCVSEWSVDGGWYYLPTEREERENLIWNDWGVDSYSGLWLINT